MRTADFFALARERYQIFLKRNSGEPKPWTKDPILQSFRFCNVFREDDKVTVYIRKTFREPLDGTPEVLWAMVATRYFNRISTLEIIKDLILHPETEDVLPKIKKTLWEVYPILGSAYVIKTPDGMDKLTGVLAVLDPVLKTYKYLAAMEHPTLESMHIDLMQYECVGGFMSYEITSDLRHTYLLRHASDVNTFAHLGPGASRGIRRLLDLPLSAADVNTRLTKQQIVNYMLALLKASKEEAYWPRAWPQWEMREVEHVLCEFDKYERTTSGQGTPKQKYDGRA